MIILAQQILKVRRISCLGKAGATSLSEIGKEDVCFFFIFFTSYRLSYLLPTNEKHP